MMHTSLFILQIGISSQGLGIRKRGHRPSFYSAALHDFYAPHHHSYIPNFSFLISHDRQRYEIAMTPNKYQLPTQLSI